MRTLIIVLLSTALQGQDRPPTPYIDKGACPFDGCAYRGWVAKQTIALVAQPNSRKVIGTLHKGEKVTGITGEVHSNPVLVHASKDRPDLSQPSRILIPKGSPYYLLHYLGEGNWLAWYRGKLVQVDDFSKQDPVPKAVWWVKVKTASGLVGWTISNHNFDGQDSLA